MSLEKRRAIASKGGRAAFESGRGHRWTPEEGKLWGSKAGKESARRKKEAKLHS